MNPKKIEVAANRIRPVVRPIVFESAHYKPHKYQNLVHESTARFRVAACGRRFGKSSLGGMDLVTELYNTKQMYPFLHDMGKRREFWIVGPNYSDSEKEFRVAYDAFRRLQVPFDSPGTYNNPNTGDMQISAFDGKFILHAKSAAKPERLVGEGLNGVIMAEAAKQKESTWLKFIRPMLSDYNGWALFSSTPEGRNWFYEMWNRGQSEHFLDYESWRLPSWLNSYIYEKTDKNAVKKFQELIQDRVQITEEIKQESGIDPEIISLIMDLTQETFNQEIAALFTEFVGRVFKEFDEEIHVRDLNYEPTWETVAAVDYGFTNPFVWLVLQIDPRDGTVHVIDEMYEPGLTIDETIREIKARRLNYPNIKYFYPDPASPGDTRAIEKGLKITGMGGTGGELQFRLRAIRAALKVRNHHLEWGNPDRKPKLFVNRKCTNTIREMNIYRYPHSKEESSNNPPESPMKKDDHCPEALGRFFAGRFGDTAPEEPLSVSTVSFAA
jgi:Terminase large subunit, T4likevirus-type, N-terminal